MGFIIRTDSSFEIGTGHVMRCLTMAAELSASGETVEFITRAHPGNLDDYIKSKGFKVHSLPNPVAFDLQQNLNDYEKILGVKQKVDAEECIQILSGKQAHWLIVDHYALDETWEQKLRPHVRKIMVIDDLANRKHDCDLLLDQTFGSKEKDYVDLVPHGCKLLLGALYALLRPEFSQWREYSLQRRVKSELKNIIISMGGIDQNNLTGQVLEVLKTCTLPKELTITVVLGAATPNIDMVKQLAVTMPYGTDVKVNVENMAELMANADLAIGAAGSTTWERCCLGLPSIQLVVADNQMLIAKNLSEAHVIEYIDNLSDLPVKLNEIVKKFKKVSLLSSMVTDGDGSKNVCDYMISNISIDEIITLKPISVNDCEYIYSLQTTEGRKYSKNPAKPSWAEHIEWFEKTISEYSSVLFIIMSGQLPAGFIRFDNINGKDMEVSIIVDPEYSGRGIAKKSLRQFIKLQPDRYFKATIHKENIPSQKVFENIGFTKLGESGDFLQYAMLNG